MKDIGEALSVLSGNLTTLQASLSGLHDRLTPILEQEEGGADAEPASLQDVSCPSPCICTLATDLADIERYVMMLTRRVSVLDSCVFGTIRRVQV